MPELDWTGMPKHQAIKSDWTTPELLLEGSLNCAKTTLWLDKEIDAVFRYPKIRSLLFRWTEDAVRTKLRPAFEELLAIRGIASDYDSEQKCFTFENGSVVYMFGLKANSLIEIYNKIRGLGVSRIGGDQIEEMSPQVAGELRGRFRPSLSESIEGRSFPFQLIFVANSEDDDFWLSREFPLDNHIKGRRVCQLSVFDNKHLPQESIDSLLRQYPEDHPKHRTMILGKRGPRVYGVPVFEGLYQKDIHWRDDIDIDPHLPILEAFECGKHNPVWIYGQRRASGGLLIFGGILALSLMLEDFIPIVETQRADWIPAKLPVKTCMSAMGDTTGWHYARVLKQKLGKMPIMQPEANTPNVRLAMIESLSAYLRRRNYKGEEYFAVSKANRFLVVSKTDGERQSPIVHHAFEGGYTWDEHFISVGHKEVRQPREDDKFANIMHAVENLEINFCQGRETFDQEQLRLAESRATASAPSPIPRHTGAFAGLI